MKKTLLKLSVFLMSIILFSSIVVPTAVFANEATEISEAVEEQKNSSLERSTGALGGASTTIGNPNKITSDDLLPMDDLKNSNLNTDVADGDKYTLTVEDEKKIDTAVDKYFEEQSEGPLIMISNGMIELYGFGKKWWNKRGFIGGVIDAALVVLGIWSARRSAQAVSKLIRANRRNITRMVESQIRKRTGMKVGSYISSAISFVGSMTGWFSVGSLLAMGLDWADGNYNGYILS